ncbi:MAG: 2,3-bisphosphoglycerate-independent phosphoglycerate mutase [Oligoflexia bacterium]|nr:2,3-bisphosphoglycerate-independent phosphoglycerate mutase [Oligoflexia bacterium]
MGKDSRVLLMILDGYGCSENTENNAIYLAKKPNLDRLFKTCPHSQLETSGHAVGLPDGIMGNSEVGHLNIGGGRVIKQELTKIEEFAKQKGFEGLPDVKRLLTETTGALHLMGLISDGGVHSHQVHLFLLLEAAARVNSKRPIYIHFFADGRDTPPKSALQYAKELELVIKKTGVGTIATLGGRYYMMDRDKRWERTQIAYDALALGKTPGGEALCEFDGLTVAINDAYLKNENDEFIKPRLIKGGARIQNGDSVLFFNYRADRARQISRALAVSDFKEFKSHVKIETQNYVTFTSYEEAFKFPVLFHPVQYTSLLGELVSGRGEKQLRIAETEKYAHVTYFFNGGEEKIYPGEDRVLVPSPKDVPTYDLKPEMSARKLTDELIKKMDSTNYKLIVLNFANSDMVGHSGIIPAAVKAIEVIDECVGRVCEAALKNGYDVLITADHGNSEMMVDPKTGEPHTAHTTNPVPLVWVSKTPTKQTLKNGILADIAPTILKIYGWEQPKEMTGHSLIT